MCSHFIYHKYNKRRKYPLTKEQNAAKPIHGTTEIKPQHPKRGPPVSITPCLISGLIRYHCVNIPELIFRYIAALSLVPVQQQRTGYFKLLFQTAVKDMKHSFQSCDRSFIASFTLCRQFSALSILRRCKISRLQRNFVQYTKINTIKPSSDKLLLFTNKWHYLENQASA